MKKRERKTKSPKPNNFRRLVPVTAKNLRDGRVSSIDLTELKMAGADLSNALMRERQLHRADFEGANLRAADLSGSSLRRACFARANLTGARLRGCDLRGADFKDAILVATDFDGANVSRADFTDAKIQVLLMGVDFDDETLWPEGFDPLSHGGRRA